MKRYLLILAIVLGWVLPAGAQAKAGKSAAASKPAVNIEFNDKSGRTVKLSSLYGKVLYIDLWATWCGPCRKEIPYVEKLVEHYKNNKKIQFVSISIDEDRDAWLELLAKDKPQWPQYITTPAQTEALTKAYGLRGIPRFIIINANGTICDADAMRPSNPDFISKMDEIIKNQKK